MLRRKLALMLYSIPMIMLAISLSANNLRADENPPISVQGYESISSMSIETEMEIYEDEYVPQITVHEEQIIMPEQKFKPIGKYYDELKHGYMKFDQKLQEYLWNKCEENNVDFYIIMSQICEESEYDPNATGYNRNGTRDMGLAQINSRYVQYFSDMMGRDIDPYNPYDAIDWLVFFHNNEKQYWNDGSNIDNAILGSYNKGRAGMKSYVRNNGYRYYYNNNIIHRAKQLITEHV